MTRIPPSRALGAACAAILAACAACRDASGHDDRARDGWRTELPDGFFHWSGTPALANGSVYVEADGDLFALDAGTGAERWRRRVGWKDAALATNILVRDGRVLVADSTNVYALDEASGAVRWRVSSGEAHGCEMAADDSTLFAGTRERTVLALDLASGAERWKRDLWPGRAWPAPVQGIARAGDTLYVAATRFDDEHGVRRTGTVVALDRRDGRELWRWSSDPERVDFNSAPTVAGRLLLLGDRETGAFLAIDRFSGRQAWRRATETGFVGPNAAPIVRGGVAYGAGGDGYAYAFGLETGEPVWRSATGATNSHISWCDGRLLVQGEGVAVIQPLTGEVLDLRFAGATTAGFAVDGSRAYTAGPVAAYGFSCR